jgi:hypothetical protein
MHVSIQRLLSRHRRIAVLLGVIVVFSVSALNVHAALCDDDHQLGGQVTVDLCLFAMAVMVGPVALGCQAAFRARRPTLNLLTTPGHPNNGGWVTTLLVPYVRAGPVRPTVLRL